MSTAGLKALGTALDAQAALVGVNFIAPCVLPDPQLDAASAMILSLEVDLISGSMAINSYSPAVGVHMQCQVAAVPSCGSADAPASSAAGKSTTAVSQEVIRAMCGVPYDTSTLYSALEAAGLQYGPQFRLLAGPMHAARTGAASAQVRAPNDASVSGYGMHPAALDNMLQLGALVRDSSTDKKEGQSFVPAALRAYCPQVAGLSASQGSLFAFAGNSSGHLPSSAPQLATHRDHSLQDAAGMTLCQLLDLEARPVGSSPKPSGAMKKAFSTSSDEDVLYEISWQADQPADDMQLQALSRSLMTAVVKGNGYMSSAASAMQALQQTAGSGLHLAVATPAAGVLPAGAARPPGNQHSAIWGMLRTFNQEHPAQSTAGICSDAFGAEPNAHHTRLLLSETPLLPQAPADGYGNCRISLVQHSAVLQRSVAQSAAQPYNWVPSPRGALTNLVPQAVPQGELEPGSVLMNVRAVGVNFRDLLSVSFHASAV